MSEYIKRKDKSNSDEFQSKYITKKKKKIDLGKIAAEAINKDEKPKYVTKKTPEQIQDRERMNRASGGRMGLKAGSKGCKLAKRGRGRAYGKNS
mgnify:FL=1|tara:strand:+ start:177 stop:458 length:282 start_codon:yes stop_codon:yes gene_type:complete